MNFKQYQMLGFEEYIHQLPFESIPLDLHAHKNLAERGIKCNFKPPEDVLKLLEEYYVSRELNRLAEITEKWMLSILVIGEDWNLFFLGSRVLRYDGDSLELKGNNMDLMNEEEFTAMNRYLSLLLVEDTIMMER